MLIIVAAAYPTEAEIQQEISKIQASPEGQEIFNPDVLRERAVSRLLQPTIEPPPEPTEPLYEEEQPEPEPVPTVQPVPEAVYEEQEQEPAEESMEPAQKVSAPKETKQRAQQLYVEYQTSDEVRKKQIVGEIMSLPYGSGTVLEWLSRQADIAERPQEQKSRRMTDRPDVMEWVLSVLNRPDVKDFMSVLKKKAEFSKKPFVEKSATNFGPYIDKNGNVKAERIPNHLKEGTETASPNDYVFRLAKSRIALMPNGNPAFRGLSYMGHDISGQLARFNDISDVMFSNSEDAKLIKQYLEDLMVAEAYKFNRWEYDGKFQDLVHGIVPAGNEGSRTYKAFENLNRVYAALAPKMNLPMLQVEPRTIIDPTDPELRRLTKTYRTEEKGTLSTLSSMLNNLIKNGLQKLDESQITALQNEVNSTLPPDQQISLNPKDYAEGGKFFVEYGMVSTSKFEQNPSKVREYRSMVTGRNVSINAPGEGGEGETTKHEYSTSEQIGGMGVSKRIQPPVLSLDPRNPMSIGIAKEIFPKMTVTFPGEEEEQTIPDPTWKMIEDIQTRAVELKKTMPATPPPPSDALVYPIRPIDEKFMRKPVDETPEQIEQGNQEMVQILKPMVDPQGQIEDPIAYIKQELDASFEHDGVQFEVKPIAGRYLLVKPLGLENDPEKMTEVLKASSALIHNITAEHLPQVINEEGQVTVDQNTINQMVRGYVASKGSKPSSYKNYFDKYISDEAAKLAKDEIVRNQSSQMAQQLNIPEDAVRDRVDEFYSMLGNSQVMEKLKDQRMLSELLGQAASKVYGEGMPFEQVSANWKMLGEDKIDLLKGAIAHEIARTMVSVKALDPVVQSIFEKIQANPSMEKEIMKRLSQAEKRAKPSLLHGIYKLVSEVTGEMIGSLMRDEFSASQGQIQAAIGMLRMVRLAISSRMMTKMG